MKALIAIIVVIVAFFIYRLTNKNKQAASQSLESNTPKDITLEEIADAVCVEDETTQESNTPIDDKIFFASLRAGEGSKRATGDPQQGIERDISTKAKPLKHIEREL